MLITVFLKRFIKHIGNAIKMRLIGIKFSRAKDRGLQFWHLKSFAIITHATVPGDCIDRVTSQHGALCTLDDGSYFIVIRLGPKTSECEKNVTVVSTVTGGDVTNCATTVHGFNEHASSRGCVRFARRPSLHRKISLIYACSHVSIIRLFRYTIRSACISCLSLVSVVPAARRTRLTQLCHHTKHQSQSVESFTSQRFRPDVARVHISLDR